VLRTAPVLAVLVCHDGAAWLPEVLATLRSSVPRPRHVLAVDTGSLDDTPALLAEAAGDDLLDGVLTLDRRTGFAAAVHEAVSVALDRWGDPGSWIWVLHDDCAPEPGCLATLLTSADAWPSAGVLGPLALDWDDPRLVVEAGLSTDASGHRQTGIGPSELDWSRLGRGHAYEQSTEVLAVPSAGLLVRRKLWERLGGFDAEIALLREDIDFGWRVNRAGSVVLCVPAARMRHVRAMPSRLRGAEARTRTLGGPVRTLDRALGLRTFLVNCSAFSFLVGLPRLAVLCPLRALGFAMQRRLDDCRAELAALGYLFGGRAGLRAARAARRPAVEVRSVHGLFTSRLTRLRNALRAGVAILVRRRLQADAALGRLPEPRNLDPTWFTPGLTPAEEPEPARRPVGPQALPAGVTGRPRRHAGLRPPTAAVAVALRLPDVELPHGVRPSPRPRPSPVPRDGSAVAKPDLVIVSVDRARLARQVLLSPPVALVVVLLGLGLWVNSARLGTDLAGGRLLTAPDLAAAWSEYLATWHPVAGGTAAPAPAALAVLGGLGVVLAPAGGVPAVVAVLLLGDLPLAGLAAYVATRRMPVDRWVRALVAAAYALLPTATAAVSQGRLDVVVAHVLLPLVTAGIVALLGRARTDSSRWLSIAAATAFGLAVLGAFAPLVHLLLVGYALAGFVLVPGRRGDGRRRVTALFVLVLMPLALLLPWPAVLIQHPGVVLAGIGAQVAPVGASVVELVSLDPGGPGAWPYVGALVVVAALVALVLRPRRALLPGLSLALLGGLAAWLVLAVPAVPITGGPAQPGWAGPGLLMAGWGLLLTVLGACRAGARGSPRPAAGWSGYGAGVRIAAALGVLGVAGLAAGAVLAGPAGPLDDEREPLLASTLVRELSVTGRSVLLLPRDDVPARMTTGRTPRLGDDDLAPVDDGTSLARLAGQLGAGPGAGGTGRSAPTEQGVRVAVAEAAAAGVLFVVASSADEGARLTEAAGDLVAAAPATSDGRPVLRLQPAAGQVTLLSPEQARRAITASPPPTDLGAPGIVPVEASPPAVAVRVSDGPAGRLLVIAAEEEPGWQATVDGEPVPVVRAWGHLVGVSVPVRSADVRVEQPTALRSVLLLVQAAMVLFVLLTAIPGRRKPEPAATRPR
jgi:GT2 family glycosyltransferase